MTTHQHEAATTMVEVGATIHTHMWRKKISQAEMGRALGVSQPTMSAKIRGKVPITVTELVTIAGVLGVDPGDLLPRLDSNQEPSGYLSAQVIELRAPPWSWADGDFGAGAVHGEPDIITGLDNGRADTWATTPGSASLSAYRRWSGR